MGRAVLCVAVLLCAACTKSEPAAESAACCTNDAPTHAPHDHAATGKPAGVVEGSRAGAAMLSAIKLVTEQTRGMVVVRVQNHGDQPVQLSTRAPLMQVSNGLGKLVPSGPYRLRWSCDAEPERCVTLAPGAELIPPAWPTRKGQGQCGACAECTDVEPGSYQVTLVSCDEQASTNLLFQVNAAP